MSEQANWGTVNLGVDVLQGHGEQSQPGREQFVREHHNSTGKQQYNPGRNQELALPADIFPMNKYERENPNYSTGHKVPDSGIHERIKELIGEGQTRREAVIRAKQEAKDSKRGDVGTISPKEVYRSKYQAEEPTKKISPLSEQVQGYPYI